MRDKDLRSLMRAYAGTPDPGKKDRFIRKMKLEHGMQPGRSGSDLGARPVCFITMLKLQLGYMRPYLWILSLAVLAASLLMMHHSSASALRGLSNFMPFLAGFGVIEGFRAEMYGMSELERTTLYSAKGTLFARMTLIGLLHLMTVIATAVIISGGSGERVTYVGAMLCIPYLLTSILCMEVERTSFGRDNAWSSLGVALVVGVLHVVTESIKPAVELAPGLLACIIAVEVLVQAYEIKKTIQMEEYAWN